MSIYFESDDSSRSPKFFHERHYDPRLLTRRQRHLSPSIRERDYYRTRGYRDRSRVRLSTYSRSRSSSPKVRFRYLTPSPPGRSFRVPSPGIERPRVIIRDELTYHVLESNGLSKTYPISNTLQQADVAHQGMVSTEWERFKMTWEDGVVALNVVHMSEYRIHKDASEKINLVCPARTDNIPVESSAIQMKWVHLQRSCLRIDILKKLVLKVPFISQELRQVAGTILRDIQESSTLPEGGNSRRLQAPFVSRHIGRRDDADNANNSETEPVIFISSPYLVLSEKTNFGGLDKGHDMLGLIQSLYGFDIGSGRDGSEVVRKMTVGSSKDTLHIPQLWCLLVGSDFLITFSELPLSDLFGNLVEIDLKASLLERPMTIRVMDENSHRYNIVIDSNSNYVDFLRDAIAVAKRAGSDATDYELFDESMNTITPQQWLRLVKTGQIEETTVCVMPKTLHRFTHRHPYQNRPSETHGRGGDNRIIRHPTERFGRDVGSRDKPTARDTHHRRRTTASRSPQDKEFLTHRRRGEQSPEKEIPRTNHSEEMDLTESEMRPENMQLIKRIDTPVQDIRPVENFSIDPIWLDKSSHASSWRQNLPPRPLPLVSLARRRHSGRSEASNKNEGTQRQTTRSDISHSKERTRRRRSSRSSRALILRGERGLVPRRDRTRRSGSIFMNKKIVNDGPRVGRGSIIFKIGDSSDEATRLGDDATDRKIPAIDVRPEHVQGGNSTRRSRVSTDTTRSSSSKRNSRRRSRSRASSYSYSYSSSDDDLSSSDGEKPSEDEYPRPGTTRFPARLVSIKAIQDLEYPFKIEGDKIVLQQALNQALIDEVLRLSHSYKNNLDLSSISASKRPFFTWKPKMDHPDTNILDSDSTVIRVLSRLHKLVSDGKMRQIYAQTFSLTMEDLIIRHDCLEAATPEAKDTVQPVMGDVGTMESFQRQPDKGEENAESPAEEELVVEWRLTGSRDGHQSRRDDNPTKPSTDSPTPSKISQPQGSITEDRTSNGKGKDQQSTPVETADTKDEEPPNTEVPTTAGGGGKPDDEADQSNTKRSVKMFQRHKNVMKRLVEVSRDLVWEFLPSDGSALVHQVTKRFWASLDNILRQLKWSVVDSGETTRWIFRSFPPPSVSSDTSTSLAFQDCNHCRNNVQYTSCEAALEHYHSYHMRCSSSNTTERPFDDPCFVWLETSSLIGDSRDWSSFIPEVESFVDQLLDLKKLTHELHCLVATPSHKKGVVDDELSLPTNLVFSFEEILAMYMMMAKEMSMMNKVGSHLSRYRKIGNIRYRRDNAFQNARRFLEESRADIILLGTTPRNVDILSLNAIGPEFLAGALAVSTQNRPLLPGTTTGALEVYQQYMSKLRYQAGRRPQRRIFLDIHSLEDELEALAKLVTSQETVLDNYRDLLSPYSYRITSTTRHALFDSESRYINAQLTRLRLRSREIQALRDQATILKDQVKQIIEILEEGHGKAIRVFTIVTLFFLPLSFTSSFFGMNTTDIRDTENDQRIFWTVSIPITAGVLALAFIYGYKGDEIHDCISLAFSSRRVKLQKQPSSNKQEMRAETWFSTTSALEDGGVEKSKKNIIGSWLHRRERVKWKQTAREERVKENITEV